MTTVWLQLVVGFSNAMLLFLVAAGLSLIFGITRVINFAHGSFYMIGAYLAYSISTWLPDSPYRLWIAALVTPVLMALIGALVEMTLLRRIYRSPELFQLILTFALVLIVADATRAIWGVQHRTLPRPDYLTGTVDFFGLAIPGYYLLVVLLGPLVGLALAYLVYRTRWGMLLRAARDDREMAAALGINQARLFTTVFALGCGLAGFGGALAGLVVPITHDMGLAVIVEAFVVVVVGGLGSFLGSFLSAVLIGVLKALGILVVPRISPILPFALMAMVLILRPRGLLGHSQ